MSKVKYRVREFTPNENQSGTHSVFAEAVINNEIGNSELAERIARRTGFKTYECQAIVAAIAEVVAEEVLESNRISLADEKGAKLVSLYPRVSGSLSDNDVLADPDKYKGATKATIDMLTDDMLKWTIGATVGIKFSKRFAIEKQAQRVKFISTDTAIFNDEEPEEPNTAGTEPQTVAVPTISGTTPFATTTQVTITGPEGAEISYTTDGSTPTASSTLYSAAFSLSATTTVKAIAIKDGISSEVKTKTFTQSTGGESD